MWSSRSRRFPFHGNEIPFGGKFIWQKKRNLKQYESHRIRGHVVQGDFSIGTPFTVVFIRYVRKRTNRNEQNGMAVVVCCEKRSVSITSTASCAMRVSYWQATCLVAVVYSLSDWHKREEERKRKRKTMARQCDCMNVMWLFHSRDKICTQEKIIKKYFDFTWNNVLFSSWAYMHSIGTCEWN